MNEKESLNAFFAKVDYIFATLLCFLSATGIIFILFAPKIIQYIEFTTSGQCYTNMYYYLLKAPLFHSCILLSICLFLGIVWRKRLKKLWENKEIDIL